MLENTTWQSFFLKAALVPLLWHRSLTHLTCWYIKTLPAMSDDTCAARVSTMHDVDREPQVGTRDGRRVALHLNMFGFRVEMDVLAINFGRDWVVRTLGKPSHQSLAGLIQQQCLSHQWTFIISHHTKITGSINISKDKLWLRWHNKWYPGIYGLASVVVLPRSSCIESLICWFSTTIKWISSSG